MAKKKKKKALPGRSPAAAPVPPRRPFFSRTQWRAIGAGVLLIVLGFILLSFTDPSGRNWQSTASPALLALGYAIVGMALAARDKEDAVQDPSHQDTQHQ